MGLCDLCARQETCFREADGVEHCEGFEAKPRVVAPPVLPGAEWLDWGACENCRTR